MTHQRTQHEQETLRQNKFPWSHYKVSGTKADVKGNFNLFVGIRFWV